MVAASRPFGCPAAAPLFGFPLFLAPLAGLLLGSLLLPATALHAASPTHAADTRSPHAHHTALQSAASQNATQNATQSATQSAGKTPAHALHDPDTHPARSSDKAANRRTDRSGQSDRASARSAHSSDAARKTTPTPRHAQAGDDPRHTTKAQGRHKRQKEQIVDEPMPVSRAALERGKRGAHTQEAARVPARDAHTDIAARTIPTKHRTRPEATSPVETAQIGTGLTTDDFLRGTRHGTPPGSQPATEAAAPVPPPSAVFASGVSHPDDDERLPMHTAAAAPSPAPHSEHTAPSTPSTPSVPAASLARPKPTPAVVATALSQSAPPPTQVVEGFGAEVDFAPPASKPARYPVIVLPRESPAQQERELRAAADVASQPMFVPLYARDGKLIVPPPLKGSHDILVHQNQMADDAGLARIQDDDDLDRLRRARLLVDFPESASLHMNESLPENRRCARPWTVRFATDMAHAFYARFGESLQVNSAVRTVAYQLRLQRTNGNAAAVDGEGASPHLTGQAIDFGKRGMSVAEIAWMRSYLLPLIDSGKIDVEEEFQQACFHISVYAAYTPAPRKPHAPATTAVAQVSKSSHSNASLASAGTDDLR